MFEQAKELTRLYHPDFLLIHPMGVDWAGHFYGGVSEEYFAAVTRMDSLLEEFRIWWKRTTDGAFLVGADHGMGLGHHHDGGTKQEREVSYYLDPAGKDFGQPICRQHQVRRLIETLLGV